MPKMISNPKAGTEDGLDQVVLHYECASAVTAKQLVQLDTAFKVATAAAAAPSARTFGVALESGVAGSVIPVCVKGVVKGLVVDAAVASGAVLIQDLSTAGAVSTAAGTEASQLTIGFAIAASYATNTRVDAYINKA